MKNNRTRNILITLILIAAIGFAYYKFILSVQLARLQTFKAQIVSSQAYLADLEKIKSNKTEAEDKIIEVQKVLADLDVAIPPNPDEMQYNLWLYSAIKQMNLTILKVTPVQEKQDEKAQYNTRSISIEVNGDQKDVLGLLQFFREQERKIKIKQVALRLQGDGLYTVSILIQVFSVPE